MWTGQRRSVIVAGPPGGLLDWRFETPLSTMRVGNAAAGTPEAP